MVKVKICGLTNIEDARKACKYGADYLGFIFVKDTPRFIGGKEGFIREIPKEDRQRVGMVGLFKDEAKETVVEAISALGFDLVQLHGGESPEYCRDLKRILSDRHSLSVKIIKAFKVDKEIISCDGHAIKEYEEADYLVFDTFHPEISGGSGMRFDWEVLREGKIIDKPFFLAGGLEPDNVAQAVTKVHPFGVDVSSGIEKEIGIKDDILIKEFINNAKKA